MAMYKECSGKEKPCKEFKQIPGKALDWKSPDALEKAWWLEAEVERFGG